MPAINMGGDPTAENPSTGRAVLMCPFSGPKGSMLDKDQPGNHSTGALSTGIGFGPNLIISAPANPNVRAGGFNVPYSLGATLPSGSTAPSATLMAIGGGRSTACENGAAETIPLTTTTNTSPLVFAFGNGAARDGTDPGSGRVTSMRTAGSNVPDGSGLFTGITNRSGKTVLTGQTTLGVTNNASTVVSPGGTIGISNLNLDNTAKIIDPTGPVAHFKDGAELTVTISQGETTVTGDAVVNGGTFDTNPPISLASFSAGTINVSVSGVDDFGFTVTTSQSAAYAPA